MCVLSDIAHMQQILFQSGRSWFPCLFKEKNAVNTPHPPIHKYTQRLGKTHLFFKLGLSDREAHLNNLVGRSCGYRV
jgi:hypothetical protein